MFTTSEVLKSVEYELEVLVSLNELTITIRYIIIKNQDMSLKQKRFGFVVAKVMFAMAKLISSWGTKKQGKGRTICL